MQLLPSEVACGPNPSLNRMPRKTAGRMTAKRRTGTAEDRAEIRAKAAPRQRFPIRLDAVTPC